MSSRALTHIVFRGGLILVVRIHCQILCSGLKPLRRQYNSRKAKIRQSKQCKSLDNVLGFNKCRKGLIGKTGMAVCEISAKTVN